MHPIAIVSLSVLVSGVTSWAVSMASASPAEAAAASEPSIARGASAADSIAALRAELEELRSAQSLAPVRVAARQESADGNSQAIDIASVVRSLVAEDALRSNDEDVPGWPGGATSAALAVQAILDADVNSEEARALWAEAAKNGQLHELLAEMERQMEDVPESADKHFDRARAYYAAARQFPGNADGNWWVNSNDAFTQALEHDPEHWEARYQKAHNMSFWPVAYGGQAEAIRHFETLVGQQQRAESQPKFAQTYVYLGNLYDQQGNSEAARAAWESGLAAFPGDSWLLQRLASLDQ